MSIDVTQRRDQEQFLGEIETELVARRYYSSGDENLTLEREPENAQNGRANVSQIVVLFRRVSQYV
jgi:hypothetical protein